MCTCSNNGCGCDSEISLPWLSGSDGTNGIFGGYSGKWIFKSATNAPPLSNTIRFNSALSTTTNIYVHDSNFNGTDYDLFLDSFSNTSIFGPSYGWLRVFKESDSNVFWMGTISNVVDNGTYHTLTVVSILSNGSFTEDDPIVISFVPKGNNGTAGSNAETKAWVQESYAQTPYIQHKPFGVGGIFTQGLTIPANQLLNIGDTFKFEINLTGDTDNSIFGNMDLEFNDIDEISTFNIFGTNILIQGSITRTASDPYYTVTVSNYDDGILTNSKIVEGHSTVISDFSITNTIKVRLLNNLFTNGVYLKKVQSEIILKS
jgi:hypothetical protein